MTFGRLRLVFYRALAVCYGIGGALHVLDVLSLRIEFSAMTLVWKVWIVFLLIADAIAAVGLWKVRSWGMATFLSVAGAQLIAYTAFQDVFGEQGFLIGFHLISVAGFLVIAIIGKTKARDDRPAP